MKSTICIAANTTWYIFNFRSRLVAALHGAGYRVVALSPNDAYVPQLNAAGVEHIDLRIRNSGLNPLLEVQSIWRMWRSLRAVRPSLLLTFTPKVNIYGSFSAAMIGIPAIANVSGLGRSFGGSRLLEKITRCLYRLAFLHPSKVYFQNEDDHREFTRSNLVNAARAARLPGSGVDIQRFRPKPRRIESDGFVFLFSARLIWAKGIGEFVEAARQVRKRSPLTKFWVLGPLVSAGKDSVALSDLAAWKAEGVAEYLGAVDDVRETYSLCDCVVLPSYYREGVPRSLLEAASMGIPTITTDTAGCRDAVEHGVTGLICKPKNVSDLASRMWEFMSYPKDVRTAMGAAARQKIIREYDEKIVLERYLTDISEVLRSQ